jgi:uncharacterized protein YdhG (YjbR/CyaY superfamily)
MKATKHNSIEEYIKSFPKDTQIILEEIRKTIKNTVPEIEEKISYAMPTYTLNGHYVVYVAAYKNHIGVYPVPTGNEEFKKDFSLYKTSGKGTIQFPLNEPMPFDLIIKIVKYRAKENLERAPKLKKKSQ